MNRIQIVERNKASLGLRFVNRIVDLICFYVLLIIILYLFSFIARVTESDLLIGFLMNFFQRGITFCMVLDSVPFIKATKHCLFLLFFFLLVITVYNSP